MNQLGWAGIAYAVYLGVKNWHQLEKMEEGLDALVEAVKDHQNLLELMNSRNLESGGQ